MFTKLFWKDALERAVSTAAQAAGAAILALGATGLVDLDFKMVGSVAGLAALLSVLKSVAATKLGDKESASLAPSIGVFDAADTSEFEDDDPPSDDDAPIGGQQPNGDLA